MHIVRTFSALFYILQFSIRRLIIVFYITYLPVHISTCVFSFFFFSLRRKLYTTTKPNSRASHKGKRKIQKPKAKPKIRKGFTEPIGINARKIHATRTKISRDFSNKRLVCTEEGEAHSLLFVTRDTNTGI